MRLIMADLVRRHRVKVALLAGMVIVMAWGSDAAGALSRGVMAIVAITFLLSAILMQVPPQAIWYLPVSRRDVWRGSWLASTIGVTGLLTTARVIAALLPGSSPLPAASVVLWAVYNFAATGVACALVIVATRPPARRAPWRQLTEMARSVATVALALGWAAIFAGNAAATRVNVPIAWSGIPTGGRAVLAGAVLLAVATYFHTPTHTSRLYVAKKRAAPPAGASAAPWRGVGGMPRLLLREYTLGMTAGLGGAAASAVMVCVMARFTLAPEPLRDLLVAELRLLDGVSLADADLSIFTFMTLNVFMIGMLSASPSRFPLLLRHLRALPLSGAQIIAIMVAGPAAVWSTLWLLVIALHIVAIGSMPATLHVPFLVTMSGLNAVLQAFHLRANAALRAVVTGAGIGGVILVAQLPVPPAWTLLLGVSLFAAAALVNRSSLARNSTYHRRTVQVGALQVPV